MGDGDEISRDAFGRATNEILRQNGNIIFLSATSYDAATGRISSATFGGIAFAYGYLSGTNLISQIAVADGAILTKKISYEAQRDFQTEIAYVNSANALIAKRNYVFDTLVRVSGRTQTRGTDVARADTFGYNARSELISAAIGNENFTYDFDNIGNRTSTTEAGTINVYTTTSVNQYSAIMSGDEAFSPTYDFDGNATLIKTSTGTWSVSWNAENRPIRFENAATETVVTLTYDALGRCAEREVSSAGTVVSRECFVYKDFLQIAAFDVAEDATGTRSFSLKRTVFWDPTEPIATRPLAVNIVGDQVYFPTVDLTKNVCELVKIDGSVAAFYDYTPFGLPTETSTAGTGESVAAGTNSDGTTSAGTSNLPANPFKFSSEVYDSDLGLVYYNYRHYSPTLGRFLSRDPIEELGGLNLYAFVRNNSILNVDSLGLKDWTLVGKVSLKKSIVVEFNVNIIPQNATALLVGATTVWDLWGEATCRRGGRTAVVSVEKRHTRSKKTHIALLRVVPANLPAVPINLFALISELVATAVNTNLTEVYYPGIGSEKELRRFLKTMGTLPALPRDFWGDDVCKGAE